MFVVRSAKAKCLSLLTLQKLKSSTVSRPSPPWQSLRKSQPRQDRQLGNYELSCMKRYELTDNQWNRIEALLPGKKPTLVEL